MREGKRERVKESERRRESETGREVVFEKDRERQKE